METAQPNLKGHRQQRFSSGCEARGRFLELPLMNSQAAIANQAEIANQTRTAIQTYKASQA
jgi:hypothetical protein